MVPPTISAPRTIHAKRVVPPSEEAWLRYQTVFKYRERELRTPLGTAKPYLPDSFIQRENAQAELNFLITTQFLELATVAEELRATGVGSFDLSSSPNGESDDDITREASISEARGCGTPYTRPDLEPVMQNIALEKFNFKCGPVSRIFIAVRDDGSAGISSDQPAKVLPPTALAVYGPALKSALNGRTLDELQHDRHLAAALGIGSKRYGVTTGPVLPIPSVNGPQETDDEDESLDGPKELGFDEVDEGANLTVNEPPETVLWPVTISAIIDLIRKRQPLNDIEYSWLDRHPHHWKAVNYFMATAS
jgi:hypothetical protein